MCYDMAQKKGRFGTVVVVLILLVISVIALKFVLPGLQKTNQPATDRFVEAAKVGRFDLIPEDKLREEYVDLYFSAYIYGQDFGDKIRKISDLRILNQALAEKLFQSEPDEALANLPVKYVTDQMLTSALGSNRFLSRVFQREALWTSERVKLLIEKRPDQVDDLPPDLWGRDGLRAVMKNSRYAREEMSKCPSWDEELVNLAMKDPIGYSWLPEPSRTWERSLEAVSKDGLMLQFVPWEQRLRENGLLCQIALKQQAAAEDDVARFVPDFFKYNWAATQPEP